MQSELNESEIIQQRERGSRNPLHAPALTVARLTLASYLRSGWMWAEFVLVLVFYAAIFFPYLEETAFFNGVATFSLGGIAILGPAIMVRQATSARTYLLLARLNSRSSYSRSFFAHPAVPFFPAPGCSWPAFERSLGWPAILGSGRYCT